MSRASAPLSVAGRIVLAVLAVVVCAWFALGVRAFKNEDSVNALLGGPTHLTPAQAHGAQAALDRAAVLNPDQDVSFLRAQVAARSGQVRRARALAAQLTRREPQNDNSWLLVSLVNPHGSASYRLAEARLRQLVPPVPR